MDTCRGRGPLGDASRARRASLLRLAGCDMVVRTFTTLPREDRELVGTGTPLAEETPEVGRREKEDFPLAGTKATLVPGFISSGVPDKSSFWPADTITGVEPEDAVREAADTATAAEAMWGLGRMERRPGAFWECWATTMTIGCSSGGWESSPSPVFRFLAATERASNHPVHYLHFYVPPHRKTLQSATLKLVTLDAVGLPRRMQAVLFDHFSCGS